MHKGLLHSTETTIGQEQQALKLFLLIFFGIGFAFDTLYFYIYPNFWSPSAADGESVSGTEYALFVLQFLLLPVAIYGYRKPQLFGVKYGFVFVYVMITLAYNLMVYTRTGQVYGAIHASEALLILFCPIFLSRRYYWVVVGSITTLYAVMFALTGYPSFMKTLALYLILSMMAYMLLVQHIKYVEAVKGSFTLQMEGVVKGVIATLELKDPYTRGHSERVAYFSLELAKRLNQFSEEEMKSYYYACLLHDVGKVSVPDHILTKPASLTDKEYEVIKSHPVVGLNVIKHIDGLQDSLSVVLHHHERWDGKGYPHKLSGEEIPILARLTAVADAFDAMTTKRSYREALSVEEAYERIVYGKGTQFDPSVVELFSEVFPKFVQYVKSEHAKMSYSAAHKTRLEA
jgi:HD-GYP domain-containing protein (c-di-GMP phosphodiesterase class II)